MQRTAKLPPRAARRRPQAQCLAESQIPADDDLRRTGLYNIGAHFSRRELAAWFEKREGHLPADAMNHTDLCSYVARRLGMQQGDHRIATDPVVVDPVHGLQTSRGKIWDCSLAQCPSILQLRLCAGPSQSQDNEHDGETRSQAFAVSHGKDAGLQGAQRCFSLPGLSHNVMRLQVRMEWCAGCARVQKGLQPMVPGQASTQDGAVDGAVGVEAQGAVAADLRQGAGHVQPPTLSSML